MAEHTFGGDWTESKLACLAKYLTAYRAIFINNEKAKHFSTWYVDAFAGSGSRVDASEPSDTQLFADAYDETTGYREGSARKALGLAAPFDHYLFIDKSKSHLAALKAAIETDFPTLLPRCVFEVGDSNEVLSRWCAQRDWKKDRAVVRCPRRFVAPDNRVRSPPRRLDDAEALHGRTDHRVFKGS